MHNTKKRLAAMVYMDYENIQDFLHRYGKDPLEMEFFPVLLSKFKHNGLKIGDFMVYGNFERGFIRTKQQTYLRNLGLQTRQSYSGGKNTSDLELTVDTLRTLYKTPGVDVFVIIISGRDIIPLLKTIRLEGKLSYLVSTRNSFNQVVAEYADHHEYLEDIFGLGDLTPLEQIPVAPDPIFNPKELTGAEIDRAKEVAKLFYNSQIWRRAVQLNEPVNLSGYTQAITKAVLHHSGDILDSFKLAHALQFITIYHGPDSKLFIKEGAKKEECV